MEIKPQQTNSGRRQFLQTVFTSAVVASTAHAGFELTAPTRVSAQTDLSPDAALQELLTGNRAFRSKPTDIHRPRSNYAERAHGR